jgi:tryptophan synthase beta subunit
LFTDWFDDDVAMVGVEGAGHGINTNLHSATLSCGSIGILHGTRSYLLQDDDGQVQLPHSISAGLDYPGVGPQHSYLKETGRVTYTSATDTQAIQALQRLSRCEGIIPALESAHAIAKLYEMAETDNLGSNDRVVVCLSGRGDKDVEAITEHLNAHPEKDLG